MHEAQMTRPELAFYIDLGRRIRDARLAAGMSQRQLGQRLEVTHVCIHYWESGKYRPSLYAYERLRKVLGL